MIPKQQAYDTIGELVERFHEQLASYKKSDYNETLVRRDFVELYGLTEEEVGIVDGRKG